jgi:hypothetical protein
LVEPGKQACGFVLGFRGDRGVAVHSSSHDPTVVQQM